MDTLSTDVLVIGGGATGAGIVWDATLRGLGVILVDRRDLAEGTSGRFHGLLHSGGRYAVVVEREREHRRQPVFQRSREIGSLGMDVVSVTRL